MKPLLLIEGLRLAAGKRELISGLALQVERGQLWCLLGPNGAGKTTLLATLAGLRRPVAGSVRLEGEELFGRHPRLLALQRGFLPQQQVDAFSHSVLDTVLLGRTPFRLTGEADNEQDLQLARAALAEVGLSGWEERDVLGLSGGERQRVALAALLTQAPPLMLLDEPLSHQDIAHQLQLMRLLRARLENHAVLMSCHDLNLAARHASHVLLLAAGKHWAGPAAEILTPQRLQQAYGCRFRQDGQHFYPEEA